MTAARHGVAVVADLDNRTVVTVEDVASLLGISRSAAYEAASRGDFPVRRVGRRLFVPVPALKRWLGIGADLEARGSPSLTGAAIAVDD